MSPNWDANLRYRVSNTAHVLHHEAYTLTIVWMDGSGERGGGGR